MEAIKSSMSSHRFIYDVASPAARSLKVTQDHRASYRGRLRPVCCPKTGACMYLLRALVDQRSAREKNSYRVASSVTPMKLSTSPAVVGCAPRARSLMDVQRTMRTSWSIGEMTIE